jgi:hypothetical protein
VDFARDAAPGTKIVEKEAGRAANISCIALARRANGQSSLDSRMIETAAKAFETAHLIVCLKY